MQVFEKSQLIVSADREKTVRVWDLLRPQCMQIIKFKESDFPGKQGFSTVFLDPINGNDTCFTDVRISKLQKKNFLDYRFLLIAYTKSNRCFKMTGKREMFHFLIDFKKR